MDFIENTFKNGRFRAVYQQNGAFIHKKQLFFAQSLVWQGFYNIFVSIIFFYTN